MKCRPKQPSAGSLTHHSCFPGQTTETLPNSAWTCRGPPPINSSARENCFRSLGALQILPRLKCPDCLTLPCALPSLWLPTRPLLGPLPLPHSCSSCSAPPGPSLTSPAGCCPAASRTLLLSRFQLRPSDQHSAAAGLYLAVSEGPSTQQTLRPWQQEAGRCRRGRCCREWEAPLLLD